MTEIFTPEQEKLLAELAEEAEVHGAKRWWVPAKNDCPKTIQALGQKGIFTLRRSGHEFRLTEKGVEAISQVQAG